MLPEHALIGAIVLSTVVNIAVGYWVGASRAYASLGYVTVQAGASLWTAGTDALTTGSGGTVAATTTYYDDPSLNGTFGGWQIGNLSGTAITQ